MKKTEEGKIIKKQEVELGIPKTKWDILDVPTPKEKIKKRKGRGGMIFDYVDTGYVVKKLDEVFNKAWDFEVVDKQVGQNHIWVLGKLTVKFIHNGQIQTITKMQFGGSEVKRTKTGEIIDIGDDLKSAASDALKKCASLLGVAGDIYFQEKHLNTQDEVNKKWQEVEAQAGGLKCEVCGSPAVKKSGTSQSGKQWNAIFCSKDKSHIKWLKN